MSFNNIITSVNALSNNVIIPESELNNVVCIDTANNRIGVKNSNPLWEIDVSGVTKSSYFYINNNNNTVYDISSDISLSFSKGLITNDISVNTIYNNSLTSKYVISDISFIGYVDISGDVFMDNSLNVDKGVTCSKVFTNQLITPSDDRLKHNEVIINNALETIRKLDPMVYDKTTTIRHENYHGPIYEYNFKEAGLIAQDIYNISELSYNVVPGNSTTPFFLNYNGIHIYTLAAVKELDNIVNKHIYDISNINTIIDNIPDLSNVNLVNIQNLIRSQNNLINTLSSRLNILENKVNNI